MNSRVLRRAAAVVFVCCLALGPTAGAASRQKEAPGLGDRVVRVIKSIRNILVPSTHDGGTITPPKP